MRYLILALLVGCGPVGDDISNSWECMNGSGHEYCDPAYPEAEEQSPETSAPEGVPGPAGDQGVPGEDGVDGRDGSSCSVIQSDDAARIRCEDGSEAEISNAGCSVVQLDDGVRVECMDGTSAVISNGTSGAPGNDGIDGADGSDGSNGSSCTVVQDDKYVTIACDDGTSVTFKVKTEKDNNGKGDDK